MNETPAATRGRLARKTLAALIVALWASAADAAQVTLRLVDQTGAGQTGAQFSIASQSVGQDGSVTLAPGIYPLTVMPPINGQPGSGSLSRVDTVQVGTVDTLISRTWHYANLTVRLVDQDSAPDDSALFTVFGLDRVGQPTYRLPVTVEQPGDAAHAGTLATGYSVAAYPSINQKRGSGALSRVEAAAELDTGGLVRTFEWKRSNLAIHVVDQDSAPIPASFTFVGSFNAPNQGGVYDTLANGDTARLPVTVDPDHPAVTGVLATGYRVLVYPGINGLPGSGSLTRFEPGAPLTAAGATRTFEWKLASLTIHVVDQDSVPIPASFTFVGSFNAPNQGGVYDTLANGDTARLPVTVDPDHPAVTGVLATGYRVLVYPGINGLPGSGSLTRFEPGAPLTAAGATRTFEWKLASLTIHVVDQDSVPIPASFTFVGSFNAPNQGGVYDTLANGDTARLPVTVDPDHPAVTGVLATGYRVLVYPGINGLPGSGSLTRFEPGAPLTAAGATRTFEWKLASLTIHVVDQDSAPIPASFTFVGSFSGPGQGGLVDTLANGDTARLPVTVDPDHPAVTGVLATGYRVLVYPGINGLPGSGSLTRFEPGAPLTAAGATRTFEWKLASLTIHVVDQDSVPIPASFTFVGSFSGPGQGGLVDTLANGDTARLPVTEDADHPAVTGVLATGYRVLVYPGINGLPGSGSLTRFEPGAPLTAAGATRTFEWKLASLTIHVVDQDSVPIPASFTFVGSFSGPGQGGLVDTLANGDTARLPVTEDADHPAVTGVLATGYRVLVYPGINGLPGSGSLTRFEPGAPLTAAGATRAFEWETATGPLVVADSSGMEVPGSAFCLSGVGCVSTGTSVWLPVSSDPSHAPTLGAFSNGYEGSLRPGPSGSFVGPFTFRLLPGPVFDPEFVVIDSSRYGLRFAAPTVTTSQLRVDVVGPGLIRANYRTAFDLVLENQGNVEAQAVPLWITGVPANATVEPDFVVSPPPQEAGEPDWSQAPLTFTSHAGQYFALVIPRVAPGVQTRRVYFTVPADNSTFHVTAALTPPWTDGASFRSCLADGGVITNTACMGAQLTAINSYLAASAGIEALSAIGLWAKVAWQCEGAATLPDALTRAEQVLDFLVQPVEQQGSVPASCGEGLAPRWREARAVGVVSSVDPNDKLGQNGTLSGQQAIPYSIRFENADSATARAQRVLLVDALDLSRLDVNTVSLQAIHFGDRILVPPPGLSSFADTVDLRPARNLKVAVGAALDRFTGVLSWYFTSLDPVTRQPIPGSSLDGFLPPNHAPPEGEGRVLFTVLPRGELATGSEIRNHAAITFDANPVVTTPQWVNTVDNTPPESHVLPLTAGQDSAHFTVRWEALNAADVRDFTVYAREDTGKFRPWRANTAATADTFAARRGHSYAFYCVARDSAGNVEPAVPAAEAQTTSLVAVEGAPSAWRLALAGALPNPARGEIHAHFTLPSAEPARLELYDVAGRRLVRREVGALGPGPHMVALGASRQFRPGLYFLRLAQGGRVLGARVAVIR